MWYWHGMGPWGWLLMVGFWLIVIFLIVWAVRMMSPRRVTEKTNALRILNERLARGEIEPEEYERRREALDGHP